MVTPDESTNNFGLTRWLKRRLVAVFFACRHYRHYLRPIDEQILQPVIDFVEPPAQVLKIGRRARHRFLLTKGRLLVWPRPGKIKENVDMAGSETLASAAHRETATTFRCASPF